MDKRLLIYHPLRWKEIHRSSESQKLFTILAPEELAGAGLTREELKKVQTSHAGVLVTVKDFEDTGSNIFHLQAALVEMFRNSSVDEICLDTLKMPFETFYVYFGTASGLRMEGCDTCIDGAYIWNSSDENNVSISITLTCELDVGSVLQVPWLQRFVRDANFQIMLRAPRGADVTVRKAFDELFINPYDQPGYKGLVPLDAELKEALSENWCPDPGHRDPAIRPALNLAFNAICYLAY